MAVVPAAGVQAGLQAQRRSTLYVRSGEGRQPAEAGTAGYGQRPRAGPGSQAAQALHGLLRICAAAAAAAPTDPSLFLH